MQVNSSSPESEISVKFGEEVLCVVYKSGVPFRISRFPESVLMIMTNSVCYWNIELKSQYNQKDLPVEFTDSEVYTVLFYEKKPAFDGQLLKFDEVYMEGLDFYGGKYYGQCLNQVPDGLGILEYKDYKILSKFSNGQTDGKGEIVGYIDLGDFKASGMIEDNKLNGYAEIHFNNGDKYIGEVKKNAMDGKGKYLYSDGSEYEGHFHLNLKHGEGVYKFKDGTLYYGIWTNDKAFGPGKAVQGNKITQVNWYNI